MRKSHQTMLVQPRHLKLYYAGSRKNWELAAFQARELRNAFRRISEVYPRYQGIDLTETVKTMLMPSLQEVDAAIAAANATRFEAAITQLTAACNSCHVFTEHPFLVMKVPDPHSTPSFVDQEFAPPPP